MQIPVHHSTSVHSGAAASGAPARKPAGPVGNGNDMTSFLVSLPVAERTGRDTTAEVTGAPS